MAYLNMPDERQLADKSKEELIRIIIDQDTRIRELEDAVRSLQKKHVSKFAKPDSPKKRKKRPGQKPGHPGTTRPIPTHIDETLDETLGECPFCKHALGSPVGVKEEIQEDIVPMRVVVRKYRRHRYSCEHCGQDSYAPYHPLHVPNGYLGANVLVHAAILKHYHCLPYIKICELFQEMAGLTVSPGGLSQALARLGIWLGVEKKELLGAIRGSPQVHVDETGWRLDGKRGWVWALVNKELAYYKVDRSRGRRVLKELLGEEFSGTIISDFYSVYLKLPYRMQKCLVHLLRDFHDSAKTDNTEEFASAYRKIKRLINDALRLYAKHGEIGPGKYARLRERIEDRMFYFMAGAYSNKNLKRLSKRFSRSWSDMLLFLKDPQVSWNNNLAERMIRPNVIYRNRSFGNRSERGAETYGTLMSLIQTLKLQGKDVGKNLQIAFLRHRQGHPEPCLSLGIR